ncbi:energy-coupling factor ABC transporter ATP-binding protein [Methanocella conradii]|uniref:energy-coupling factor ABC transporter ATP-binding protein n=1 Tax=Methanocella conradii TaxID=1175444 RepID=UPI00157DE65F|nr:ATP-binding cassette domain-containing protein [Methanocella conradii]
MIELRNVSYSYGGLKALDRVSLAINRGERVALVGPNASGKSTLARIMNALLLPCEGECIVDGVDTKADPMHARKAVGMVFQDPDSQIVARRVVDDVAFGPRNLGLPEKEVQRRVFEALKAVGLEPDGEAQRLSGGQKQLLAIAGVLAMRPSYVILDEPTTFLDCRGSRLVEDAISGLKGLGVVVITHDMEEAARADRLVALSGGRVVADSTPERFFSDDAQLAMAGVEPPYSFRLRKASIPAPMAHEVVRSCR